MDSDDDLLDDLFPSRKTNEKIAKLLPKSSPGDPNVSISIPCCLVELYEKVTNGPFDEEAFKLAIESIGNTIPNPLPVIRSQLVSTVFGALEKAFLWVYVFIIVGLVILCWIIACANGIPWGLALIFTVLIILIGIFIGFFSRYLVANYVSSKSDELEKYIQNWLDTYLTQIPSALCKSTCIYACPPDGKCVNLSGCSPCLNNESKKTK